MRKSLIFIAVAALLCVGLFLWLLSGSNPDKLERTPTTIDLTDQVNG